jgi:hypothetical protein
LRGVRNDNRDFSTVLERFRAKHVLGPGWNPVRVKKTRQSRSWSMVPKSGNRLSEKIMLKRSEAQWPLSTSVLTGNSNA